MSQQLQASDRLHPCNLLGFVSLLMDISSEMIHSLLPLFMVGTLGASALVVGVIEGLAEATASLLKLFSGLLELLPTEERFEPVIQQRRGTRPRPTPMAPGTRRECRGQGRHRQRGAGRHAARLGGDHPGAGAREIAGSRKGGDDHGTGRQPLLGNRQVLEREQQVDGVGVEAQVLERRAQIEGGGGVAGAVMSMVTLSAADVADVLPARSVAVAVKL